MVASEMTGFLCLVPGLRVHICSEAGETGRTSCLDGISSGTWNANIFRENYF